MWVEAVEEGLDLYSNNAEFLMWNIQYDGSAAVRVATRSNALVVATNVIMQLFTHSSIWFSIYPILLSSFTYGVNAVLNITEYVACELIPVIISTMKFV